MDRQVYGFVYLCIQLFMNHLIKINLKIIYSLSKKYDMICKIIGECVITKSWLHWMECDINVHYFPQFLILSRSKINSPDTSFLQNAGDSNHKTTDIPNFSWNGTPLELLTWTSTDSTVPFKFPISWTV